MFAAALELAVSLMLSPWTTKLIHFAKGDLEVSTIAATRGSRVLRFTYRAGHY